MRKRTATLSARLCYPTTINYIMIKDVNVYWKMLTFFRVLYKYLKSFDQGHWKIVHISKTLKCTTQNEINDSHILYIYCCN